MSKSGRKYELAEYIADYIHHEWEEAGYSTAQAMRSLDMYMIHDAISAFEAGANKWGKMYEVLVINDD